MYISVYTHTHIYIMCVYAGRRIILYITLDTVKKIIMSLIKMLCVVCNAWLPCSFSPRKIKYDKNIFYVFLFSIFFASTTQCQLRILSVISKVNLISFSPHIPSSSPGKSSSSQSDIHSANWSKEKFIHILMRIYINKSRHKIFI